MDGIVKDKNYVLTGFYQNENAVADIITKLGGKVRSSTVKDTDYIIYAETGTTKYKKAVELKEKGRNIVFIPVEDFIEWWYSVAKK